LSQPLKDRDSFCKTAISRREDILSCIDVTIGARIDIARDDRTIGFDQSRAELVEEIFPPVRDLGVNRPGAIFLSRPLRCGKLRFPVAVEGLGLYRWQVRIAKGRELSQPQVNAEARNRLIQDRLHPGLVSGVE
jgi:hypothetical protein